MEVRWREGGSWRVSYPSLTHPGPVPGDTRLPDGRKLPWCRDRNEKPALVLVKCGGFKATKVNKEKRTRGGRWEGGKGDVRQQKKMEEAEEENRWLAGKKQGGARHWEKTQHKPRPARPERRAGRRSRLHTA